MKKIFRLPACTLVHDAVLQVKTFCDLSIKMILWPYPVFVNSIIRKYGNNSVPCYYITVVCVRTVFVVDVG